MDARKDVLGNASVCKLLLSSVSVRENANRFHVLATIDIQLHPKYHYNLYVG